MGEALKPVGQLIAQNVPLTVLFVLFLFSVFFKIPKKEVRPIEWFIGWLGKHFTRELRKDIQFMKDDSNKQIKDLRNDLDAFEERTNKAITEIQAGTTENCETLKSKLALMERSNDMQTLRQIKAHILDFANSCMNKRRHTKQDFENIIHENEEYEHILLKYEDLTNDVYTEDFNYIMKIYHKCQDEGSFLKDET